jgi:hypothetical protein
MERFSTYCGTMTEDELREHVSEPAACEPCAREFPEFVEPLKTRD